MRSSIWLWLGLGLMVVIASFIWVRGEDRDNAQDTRTAGIADSVRDVAVATTANAKRVDGLEKRAQQQHQQSDERMDRIESDAADLKARVQKVEEYIPERETAIARNFVASDLGIVGSAKVAIAEVLMSEGHAPESNRAAGLPEPTDLRGNSLRATYVRQGGVIVMEFDERSGVDGGLIQFTPDIELALRGGPLNWRCTTSDYKDIQFYLPVCSFVAPGD